MSGLQRGIGLAFGIWALSGLGMAHAQENLDAGKTAAQLYASDCALCHKSPSGLAKVGGRLGLQSFLQQHYTASRESAARIAAYLDSIDKGRGPPAQQRKAQPKSHPERHPAASAKASKGSAKTSAKTSTSTKAPRKKTNQRESKES